MLIAVLIWGRGNGGYEHKHHHIQSEMAKIITLLMPSSHQLKSAKISKAVLKAKLSKLVRLLQNMTR